MSKSCAKSYFHQKRVNPWSLLKVVLKIQCCVRANGSKADWRNCSVVESKHHHPQIHPQECHLIVCRRYRQTIAQRRLATTAQVSVSNYQYIGGRGNPSTAPSISLFPRSAVTLVPFQLLAFCTLLLNTNIGGQGEGEGGDSHRLTPQNIVPLPKTIFDPPNSRGRKFSRAPPSQMQQKHQPFWGFLREKRKKVKKNCSFQFLWKKIEKNFFLPISFPCPKRCFPSPSLKQFLYSPSLMAKILFPRLLLGRCPRMNTNNTCMEK